MRWTDLQANANQCLLYGRQALESSPHYTNYKSFEKRTGNFLVSLDSQVVFLGESNNVRKRVKRLLKETSPNNTGEGLSNKEAGMRVQVAYNDLGRKELEELKSLDTKNVQVTEQEMSKWEILQADSLALLTQAHQNMKSMRPCEWTMRQADSVAGVYIIFQGNQPIYIDHAANLLTALNDHSNNTSQSTFRQMIARNELGFTLKTQTTETSPYGLYLDRAEEYAVNHYLMDCLVVTMPVTFGRLELAEAMVNYYAPMFNVKSRKIT
ncbi:hypothetical protein GIY09_08165 [Aerococcaceae bacterium WS4759]|uniref:GIY-YIG domain-containing protein n=1 Tax=Fundicoccus ignavus TaxID=2664442 RepID=A0A6I2GKP7_9LACT|nr:hypothetical protein [Fundicoccus ignavus]MRI85839.1 hypothetical protein [Fundicoccus ignavus]